MNIPADLKAYTVTFRPSPRAETQTWTRFAKCQALAETMAEMAVAREFEHGVLVSVVEVPA